MSKTIGREVTETECKELVDHELDMVSTTNDTSRDELAETELQDNELDAVTGGMLYLGATTGSPAAPANNEIGYAVAAALASALSGCCR